MIILPIHPLRWMRSPTLWRTLQGTPLCQGQMRDLAQSAGTGKPSSFRWLPYPLKSQRYSYHVCNIPVWHQESGSRDEAVLCVHQPELPPQMDWVKISTLDFANIATNQLSMDHTIISTVHCLLKTDHFKWFGKLCYHVGHMRKVCPYLAPFWTCSKRESRRACLLVDLNPHVF